MALTNITITDIADNIVADIDASTGQIIPALAKAVFRVLAYALAGVFIILYKYGSDAFRQRFPQTATGEWLQYLGEIVDVNIIPADTWEGEAEIDATGAVGTIAAGTQFVKNDTGKVYEVTIGVVIAPGTLTLNLIATEAGAGSDLIVGDILDIVSPIAGVELTAEITVVTTQGADEEDTEEYRQRVIDRWKAKPQGGAAVDYVLWGMEMPNAENIYPYSSSTPTVVSVYVEVDNQPDGIPTGAQLIIAEDYLTYDPISGAQDRKPLGVTLDMQPIYRTEFDVEITDLLPDTPATRADILDALTDSFLQKEPYIQGLSTERVDYITYAEVVALIYAVLQSAGATVSAIDLTEHLGGAPVTIYTLGEGEKSKLETLTFS